MYFTKNLILILIYFHSVAIGAYAQITRVAGELIVADAKVEKVIKPGIEGLTFGNKSEVFDLRVVRVLAGAEKSEIVRVVFDYYGSEDAIATQLNKSGEIKRFLLNRFVSNDPSCNVQNVKDDVVPCYLLQSRNFSSIEDNRLLNLGKMALVGSSPVKIETKPSRIIKSGSISRGSIVSPNGRYLLIRNSSTKVELYKFTDNRAVRLEKRFFDISAFNFSANSAVAILTDAYGKTLLWDTGKNRKIRSIKSEIDRAESVSFSTKSGMLLVGGLNGTLYFINSKDGKLVKKVNAYDSRVSCITFSSDEETFATGSGNGVIEVWNKDHTLQTSFSKVDAYLNALTFLPDGKSILSAGDDGLIRLSNVNTGKEIKVFQGHSGTINSLFLSADGNRLVSGGSDGTVRVWKIGGQLEKILTVNVLPVYLVGFFTDFETVISGESNNINLW